MSQLTTVTNQESGDAQAHNNPAGRVLRFLETCRNPPPSIVFSTSEETIGKILKVEPGSADMYLHLARLRMQAESVPALLAPYATELNFASFFRNYQKAIDAIKSLQHPAEVSVYEVIQNLTPAVWSTLEETNRVLSQHSSELPINAELEKAYVDQVRALIDQVADDDTLSPADRSRIVDLLRKVEQALLEVKINGTLPVQEAVAAAAAIVDLSYWERIKSRPWARDIFTVLLGIYMLIDTSANVLAIGQHLSDEPQGVVVVDEHDRHELDRQDQQNGQDQQGPDQPAPPDKPTRTVRPTPTDQPTPR